MKKFNTFKIIFFTILSLSIFILFIGIFTKGISWDEPVFYVSATNTISWITSNNPFSEKNIYKYWNFDNEHPPLLKWINGTFFSFFKKKIGLKASFRLFNVFLFLLFIFFLTYKKKYLDKSLFLIILLINFRFFAHIQIAEKDISTTIFFIFSILYLKKFQFNFKSLLILSILTGLAISCKINNLFLFPVYFLYLFFIEKTQSLKTKSLYFIFILFFSFSFLIIIWPYLWQHPFIKLYAFIWKFKTHFYIPTLFLNKIYFNPPAPFYYYILLTLFTTSFPIIFFTLLFFYNLIIKKIKLKDYSLYILSLIIFTIISLNPKLPKYDGIRLFIIIPLLLHLICADFITNFFSNKIKKIFFFILFFIWIINISIYFPYESSYYSEIIGGIAGAKKIGLETQYWHTCFNNSTINFLKKYKKPTNINIYPATKYLLTLYKQLNIIPQNFFYDPNKKIDLFVIPLREGLLTNYQKYLIKNKKPVFTQSIINQPVLFVFENK